MMITRVTKVVNPRLAPLHPAGARFVANSNPAHMLTLGYLNPQGEQVTMARTTRRRASRPRNASAVNRRRNTRRSSHRRRTHNPARRTMVVHHRRRRSHNPSIMGERPMKLVEDLAAGIIGMTANNALMAALPASITGSTGMAIAASAGIAIGSGYLASMVSKDFGKYVGFGGLLATTQLIITAAFPNGIMSTIGMSGLRDFVPGKFAVPQNPVLDANPMAGGPMGGGVSGAYPLAYGIAA